MDFIQQIGIDRSVVYNFVLLSIDTKKIEEQSKNNYVNLIEDKTSPIELENGKRIGKLLIKDKKIGQLYVSYEKNNIKNTRYINSSLELILSNNLQNLTAEEYKDRVVETFLYLENKYGIRADYYSLKIKKIEVNATFYLDEPYENYKQAILLMIQNVPPSTFGNNKAIKYATWYECTAQKDTLETAVVKNSSIELKMYNKGKQLKDSGAIAEEKLNRDIMRIEFVIKDRRYLQTHFGNNSVFNLTNEKINKLFKTYFEKKHC